ncbi:MAG: protein translocase subunit SecD [Candidatus Hydrogenedentes bacterium]|nr:protein translocase subunit SecD [Candidatus Hydrogenedentota bacterium]
MSKHLYRTLLVGAVIVMAFIYVYPTVGWMLLSEESRQTKIETWQQEDDERARSEQGYISQQIATAKRWAQFDRSKVINMGLDLQGGIHMVIGFDINDLDEETLADYRERKYKDADIEREIQQIVLQQITRRINDFEAKEPIIQALGTNQVQVQLPGEKDLQRAKRLITRTAQMNFHLVVGPDESEQLFMAIRDAFPEEFLPLVKMSSLRKDMVAVAPENRERVSRVLVRAKESGIIPDDKIIAFSQAPKPFDKNQDYHLYVIETKPLVSGGGLTSASANVDQSNPPYFQIFFAFNAKSGADFADATGNNIGRNMAIVLDGVVVSAPNIQDRIAGGRGQITGSFEGAEANDLAIALNSGSMVVPVREEFTRTVSASLGQETVRRGVLSSLIGVAIVALFMLVYYMGAGIIAVICLSLNAVLVIGAMAYFGMTLTLPGIAGLILTVGMAVDANVLIYERIREELKLGHTLLTSVDNGFRRATITILDANITTLIAAAVLMQFGTGPIEGFAVTLSVGVCSSVFVALIVGRALFDFALEKHLFTKLVMMSIIRKDQAIPFLSFRKIAFVVSAAVILIGVGMFGMRGMDNFGVDFQQGTNLMLRIQSDGVVPVDDVRTTLTSSGFDNPVVQETGGENIEKNNTFIIRVGDVTRKGAGTDENVTPDDMMMQTVSERIQNALAPLSGDASVDSILIEDEQTVGPAVGAQLRFDAVNALFWALVFIMVYLWIRFELRFALGAVAALAHDLLITVGIFSLLGRHISMPVIAALLTIVGYSLNDTIVVFDRVREDMQLQRGKGIKFIAILNSAINATLSRTLLTSLTTLFVVVVLYIFGGEAINDFALVLIIGVMVGTYSSIFVASTVVYLLQKRQAGLNTQGPVKPQKSKKDDKNTAKSKGKGKGKRPQKSGARA